MSDADSYVQATSVSINSQVAGNVIKVDVRTNEIVKAGAPLFELDPVPYRIALDQAKSMVGQSREGVLNLVQTYRSKVQQIDQAQATLKFAQATFDRAQQLLDRGAGTQATVDAARRDLDGGQANVASLQRDAAAALAQLSGNADLPIDEQPQVKQAWPGLETAQRNLRNTVVYAPFDGIVTNVESIAAGAYLAPGQAAFPLVSTQDVWVEANIKETDLTYIRPDDAATIKIDAYPDTTFSAKVTTLAPASGSVFALLPPQNATGNWVKVTQRVPVRLSIEQQPNGPILRAGMSAQVSIDTGHKRNARELWRDVTSIFGG